MNSMGSVRLVTSEGNSIFDARMTQEIDSAMNVLGYNKLAPMKIASKSHQKLYSLRNEDGYAPTPDRKNPCEDFKTIIDAIKRSTTSNDF